MESCCETTYALNFVVVSNWEPDKGIIIVSGP